MRTFEGSKHESFFPSVEFLTLDQKFVRLGGIWYRIRWSSDSELCLTMPSGKVVYMAPIRNGQVVGLPITKGIKYSDARIDY